MRFLRLLVAALCLTVLGSVTTPAHAAGSLSVNTTTPMWSGRSQTDRKLDFINRQDCRDENATISFVATFVGSPGGAFEVWSGTNCDTLAARTPATATCVKVYSGTSGVNQTVTVRVRSMIRALSDDPTNAAAGDVSACDSSNSMSASTRALHFVVYDAGSNMSLIPATPKWSFKYDTVGPNPPTSIRTGSGESSLTPRFTAPTGEATLIRYHFYCSPATTPVNTGNTGGTASTAGSGGTDAASSGTGGTGGTDTVVGGADAGGASAGGTDTGGTDTGGTDTGGTISTAGTSTDTSAGGESSSGSAISDDATCGSDQLIPGQDPPAGLAECGSVTAMGADGGVTDDVLENGVRYALAVAAEDDANNIGKLSLLACGVPQEVTGFFEAYRAAGGQAGGGYCSFAPARRGAAMISLVLLLGACALIARRRR